MSEPIVFPSREALMSGAADLLANALNMGISARGAGCVALSGGATPTPAYTQLAMRDVTWAKVTFALVDERFVPVTDAASNEGMLRRALAPALARGAKLAPMYAPGVDLETAAARADAEYARLRIDMALMGMGEDGHTASWFPGAPELAAALDPATTRTIVAQRAPHAAGSSERLTLTRVAVARANTALLLITGAAKRARLARAVNEPMEKAPVAALFTRAPAPNVIWAA